MNRRTLWIFLSGMMILSGMTLSAAVPDRALVRIGGKEIASSEFEAYYRLYADRDVETPQHYLRRFILFKLKVADAHRQGWDTLPDFRQLCNVLQAQVLKRALVDPEKKRAFLQECYRRESARIQLRQWVRMESVSILLPQHASPSRVRRAEERMQNVYARVRQGVPLEEAVKGYPADDDIALTFDGDTLWRPAAGTLQELSDRLLQMRPQECSAPFVSPQGVHLVRLLEKKQEVGFQQSIPMLEAYLDRLGANPRFLDMDAYTAWNGTGMENFPESVQWELKQVSDGLLAACWDKRNDFPQKKEASDSELERFFERNKSDYAWSLPHYKGAVVHCADKKSAKRIQKLLKKVPQSVWPTIIRQWSQKYPDAKAMIEIGLFQIGKNPYVDKLAFHCGSFQPLKDYPYTFVMGKRLKNGPEEYTDVEQEVKQDFLMAQEKGYLDKLWKRFDVEINAEVLKTVNCSGTN